MIQNGGTVKIEGNFKRMKESIKIKNLIVLALIVFASISVFMSSTVLFDWFGIREKAGVYIPFMVKINLTVGFLYFLIAYGFIKSQQWAAWAMLGVALLLCYTFALFYLHIHTGGLYEQRTIVAMVLRIVFTLIFARLIYVYTDN